ncbi:hypothetical protein GPJ56_009250 [Histomonas meleagridis]|uniref:uncharacterized protein n=1 Tax=Histomonas meleagridis TaxID=135588 RepID=UPI003559EB93|nr:hypothetical protein GPJ56_009250 [Histomonas meleagridis]KAH0801621.1 hypothetical protein GO595_005620 [Histomonas meleagridis]
MNEQEEINHLIHQNRKLKAKIIEQAYEYKEEKARLKAINKSLREEYERLQIRNQETIEELTSRIAALESELNRTQYETNYITSSGSFNYNRKISFAELEAEGARLAEETNRIIRMCSTPNTSYDFYTTTPTKPRIHRTHAPSIPSYPQSAKKISKHRKKKRLNDHFIEPNNEKIKTQPPKLQSDLSSTSKYSTSSIPISPRKHDSSVLHEKRDAQTPTKHRKLKTQPKEENYKVEETKKQIKSDPEKIDMKPIQKEITELKKPIQKCEKPEKPIQKNEKPEKPIQKEQPSQKQELKDSTVKSVVSFETSSQNDPFDPLKISFEENSTIEKEKSDIPTRSNPPPAETVQAQSSGWGSEFDGGSIDMNLDFQESIIGEPKKADEKLEERAKPKEEDKKIEVSDHENDKKETPNFTFNDEEHSSFEINPDDIVFDFGDGVDPFE